MQLDLSCRICVYGREQLTTDDGLDRELFTQLAAKARLERFAGLALATRKFPVAFEVCALESPCHQNAIIPFDDGGGDDDRGHLEVGECGYDRQSLDIGHTRHFGLRAEQTIAPKSINA